MPIHLDVLQLGMDGSVGKMEVHLGPLRLHHVQIIFIFTLMANWFRTLVKVRLISPACKTIEIDKIILRIHHSDGLGSNFFDPDRVGSIFCCSGRVSHFWFWFGKFLLNIPKFTFFSLWVKKTLSVGSKSNQVKDRWASYLLWIKSMLGSGRVSAHHWFIKEKLSLYRYKYMWHLQMWLD